MSDSIIGQWMRRILRQKNQPAHLVTGKFGEKKAKGFLKSIGYRFLVANYKTRRGEIDLVFRKRNEAVLIFVEVKTRNFVDPDLKISNLVTYKQRVRINCAALDYLKELGNPKVRIQFDIVVVEYSDYAHYSIQHVPHAFGLMEGREYHA